MAIRITFVAALALAGAGTLTPGFGQAGASNVQLLALEFDAEGMLYAGDAKGSQVLALQLPDKKGKFAPIAIPDLGAQLAKLLGGTAEEVIIHDIAAHPASFAAYISAGKKGTQDSKLFRVGADRKILEVPVNDVRKAAVALPQGQMFDIAVTAKNLIVSGTSSDRTFGSGLHRIPLPLVDSKVASASTEVYHTSHKAWETRAPLISITAFAAGGKEFIVGSTKCTPVVRIPVDEIGDKAKVKTSTIIELGGGNGPTSMLVYGQGPLQTLLMTHQKSSTEGAYKIPANVLGEASKLNETASGRGGAQTVGAWKNAKKAALIGPAAALVVVEQTPGNLSLVTLPLP